MGVFFINMANFNILYFFTAPHLHLPKYLRVALYVTSERLSLFYAFVSVPSISFSLVFFFYHSLNFFFDISINICQNILRSLSIETASVSLYCLLSSPFVPFYFLYFSHLLPLFHTLFRLLHHNTCLNISGSIYM